MTPLAIGLTAAFLSGFAWAGLDAARKSLAAQHGPPVIAAGLSAGALVLFGAAHAAAPAALEFDAYLRPALVSVALGLAIQLLILESVSRGDLSRTIPLLSLTPVITALTGLAVLAERPSPRQWSGIALVCAGALLLTASRGASLRAAVRGGGAIMLAAAICISVAAPFDKLAVAASSPALHGLLQSAASLLVLGAWLGWRRHLGRVASLFARRPAMTAAALLGFAALGLQFLAYQTVMVGVVETIKRMLGLLSALVVGKAMFGEKITPKTLAAVVVMGFGVVLLVG